MFSPLSLQILRIDIHVSLRMCRVVNNVLINLDIYGTSIIFVKQFTLVILVFLTANCAFDKQKTFLLRITFNSN